MLDIFQGSSRAHQPVLEQVFHLRDEVFRHRLGWEVGGKNNREVDGFDRPDTTNIVHFNEDGRVDGCLRLLSTTTSYMLRDVFPDLLGNYPPPSDPVTIEASRFAVRPGGLTGSSGLAMTTVELIAAVLEHGLACSAERLVAVIDIRMERILRRAGWPLSRYSPPREIGNTHALAGEMEISGQAWSRLAETSGLEGPVLPQLRNWEMAA